MQSRQMSVFLLLFFQFFIAAVSAGTLDDLLSSYQRQGVDSFDTKRGQSLWTQPFQTEGSKRACTTCHGRDLTKEGQHQRTKKIIEPMAPSINSLRLSEQRKIEKWLKRNCKWTFGRECSLQEKGDLLSFINDQ